MMSNKGSTTTSSKRLLRTLIWLLPTTILFIEHIFRFLFDYWSTDYNYNYNDNLITTTTVTAAGDKDEQQRTLLFNSKQSLPKLQDLTKGDVNVICPEGRIMISNINVDDAKNNKNNLPERRIPRIIHQTSKSRCVTKHIAKAIQSWKQYDNYSYYFHDDTAVMEILQNNMILLPEFPHLNSIVRNCLLHGTIKADLWRYVILWLYGGIYSDIDTSPNTRKFHPEKLIKYNDDAFFVIEQYHLLSQWFIAIQPRHPLMYYAIQYSLINILNAQDTGKIPAALVTGPHALHAAFQQFVLDGGKQIIQPIKPGNFPVNAGMYVGTNNYTVTVIGIAANQNEYIQRDIIPNKKHEYKKMGMRHFQDDKKFPSGISCIRSLINEIL